ncbi:MAG: hypothetical protein GWN00_24455, partial [Aliifodinibius sp.]|nr:hypothetical protein [Fodinibius sp.]NIV13997.1 hypothetical protein [Fodinibius sp.]NIY27840.1 hypothetical protein [Fodinibius sp.]
MKKWSYTLIAVLIFVSGYFIVTNSKEQSGANSSPNLEPSYGGTLVIGITRDVDTFNPLYSESVFAQEITHLMMLGLADLNEKSEFQPELAEYWERSEDYLSLTYHLKKDAVWADGVPVTAEDVKFTFDLLMDTVVASPRRDITEFIQKVSVLDSHTVKFEFSQPYPYQIFDTAGEILPKHLLENADRSALRSHKIGQSPLSSGPFKLKKWKRQQYIELVPNENYIGGRPYLDRVIFKIIPNETNLLTQLRTGEIDMMIGVPPSEVRRLKNVNPGIKIYPVSGRVYYYTSYNMALAKFADKNVRRALTLAIDRQRIIDALLYGYGEVCVGHIPPMLEWAHNEEIQPLPYDQQHARALLAEAGWEDSDGDGWLEQNGRDFEFTLKTDASNQIKSDVAVIIQDQLKQIGVRVKLQLVEWTTLLDHLRERKFEAYIGGWSTSLFIDPTPIFHSSATELFNHNS